MRKKNYGKPRILVLDCKVNVLQIASLMVCGGDGCGDFPVMGDDGEPWSDEYTKFN